MSFREGEANLTVIQTQEAEKVRKLQQQSAEMARDQAATAAIVDALPPSKADSVGGTDFSSSADNLGTGDTTYATVALTLPAGTLFVVAHAVGMFFIDDGEDCRMLIRYTDPAATVTDDGMEARADPPSTADYRLTLATHVLLASPVEGDWTFELRARKIAAVATSQIQLRRLSVFAVT